MADNLIEAREFIPPAQAQVLGNYRTKMAIELMADFAAQRIAAREREIAAELTEMMTEPSHVYPNQTMMVAVGPVKLHAYIKTLQGVGEKV